MYKLRETIKWIKAQKNNIKLYFKVESNTYIFEEYLIEILSDIDIIEFDVR